MNESGKLEKNNMSIVDSITLNNDTDVKCIRKTMTGKKTQCSTIPMVATPMTKTSIDWASIARELRQQQTLKEQLVSKNRNRTNKRHI